MKRILVIGSTGMLGFAVSAYFKRKNYDVADISRDKFDIARDSIDKLDEFLVGVDTVVNCAGIIKPTLSQNTIEDVLKINSQFPRNLANLCSRKDIKCFHITTDCVYTGKKGKYTEEDFYDADDLYGLSKNAGENRDCMTLRTSIIGEEKNKSRSLLEWAKSQSGKTVKGFTNHFWNGVTTLYMAEVIENILNKSLYHKGIFHIHSLETVNKYELLRMFNEIYELDLTIIPSEAPESVDRSLASVYSLNATVVSKPLREQIEEMRKFFADAEKEILKAV